jgi:hypothetical protein
MSLNSLAAWSSAAGAAVALASFLFKRPQWTIKATTLYRLLGRLSLGVAVGFAVYFGIGAFTDQGTSHAVVPPSAAGPHSSTSTSTSPLPPVAPSTAPTKETPASVLTFETPRKNAHVDQVLSVKLTGSVPAGKHLWIVVNSSGQYYIQGTPDYQLSNVWFLPGVTLGSDAPGDANAPYTIEAVVADSSGDVAMRRALKATGGGNSGLSALPRGARIATYVPVTRNH